MLKKLYEENRLIPFVGSGLSIPFDLVSWEGMVLEILEEFTPKDKEWIKESVKDDLKKNQYISGIDYMLEKIPTLTANQFNNAVKNIFKESLKKAINKNLSDDAHNYLDLAKLNFNIYFTTNYDKLFEIYLGKTDELSSAINFQNNRENIQEFSTSSEQKTLLHLHGKLDDSTTLLTSSSTYNSLYIESDFTEKFSSTIGSNTLLFIGFSFDDEYVQRYIYEACKKLRSEHYILLAENKNKLTADERDNKQKELLENYNLKVIWYDDSESHPVGIRKILNELGQTDKKK